MPYDSRIRFQTLIHVPDMATSYDEVRQALQLQILSLTDKLRGMLELQSRIRRITV